MTKRTVKTIIAVLMILAICLYFISGTYARYTTSVGAKAEASVAKWAVSLKQGGSAISKEKPLTFTVQGNNNVVAGKIAPSVTAVSTVEVDLTGTEVAVDFAAIVDDKAIANIFGESASSVSATTTVTGGQVSGTTSTLNLPDGQKFTNANGKVTLTITLTWENVEENNGSDTTVGIAAETLVIPVTLNVQQHIGQ